LPRPFPMAKDAMIGECSTPAWSNSTQTCGEGEVQPKCLQPGFECVIAPYDHKLKDKIGRCLPNGISVFDDTDFTYPYKDSDPCSPNARKKRCGQGIPGSDAPSYGSCPPGKACGIPPNAKCMKPIAECRKVCNCIRSYGLRFG
jgi:hypothetical protein